LPTAKLPPDFDPATYLRLNPDVAAAKVDPAGHYLTFGIRENRRYLEAKYWNKAHLLGVFSAVLGLSRYLEITTNLTGQRYVETGELDFAVRRRIVYRLDGPVYDGLPVDYSSPDDDIRSCLEAIAHAQERFDLILVDGHHTHACSLRDLGAALGLLDPGGVIVMHDCNPKTADMASPEFVEAAWNGETYRALIDLCLGNGELDYFTLDIDDGCGVVMLPRSPLQQAENRARAAREEAVRDRWRQRATSPRSAYAMFDEEREALLHLGGFQLLREKVSRRTAEDRT
jgi:hypothetical protein